MSIVITGAGPIGSTLARAYAERGTAVRVLTRSGSGPEHPLIDRRSVDVNDRAALLDAARGASVIHHCIHASAYLTEAWERELPAAERTVLGVAAEIGASVVFPESLYAFDAAQQPITESSAIAPPTSKGRVRTALLDARARATAPTISLVASDYFGPGAGQNAHAGDRMVTPATSGKTVRPVGSVDQPHSWTYLPDLAAAMIRASELPALPDRLLFAPTNPPRTQRDVATDYARAAGRQDAQVSAMPTWLLRVVGRFHAGTRGIVEMIDQLEQPFVMDSSASEATLGLSPTPWPDAIVATVANGSPVPR